MKTYTMRYGGHDYLAGDKCVDFERELWFDLVKCMWRNHQSVYQDDMKYVRNDIVKPFKVKIIRYSEHVREMHGLVKHLPPPSMKGESSKADNCTVRNQEFTTGEVRLAIKDVLPKSIQGELYYHPEDYRSLTYEYWCDLLSTIKLKYERERSSAQIKKITSARAASLSDSNDSIRNPRKNKASTGVLCSNASHKQAHKHHGIQHYCVLCKKAGMPE